MKKSTKIVLIVLPGALVVAGAIWLYRLVKQYEGMLK